MSSYTNPYYPYNYIMPPTQTYPIQQPISFSTLTGKMVESQEDINPSDIPMDGKTCYFPTNDGKTIYAKAWKADGTINTQRYVIDGYQKEARSNTSRLDAIEKRLKALETGKKGNYAKRKGYGNESSSEESEFAE